MDFLSDRIDFTKPAFPKQICSFCATQVGRMFNLVVKKQTSSEEFLKYIKLTIQQKEGFGGKVSIGQAPATTEEQIGAQESATTEEESQEIGETAQPQPETPSVSQVEQSIDSQIPQNTDADDPQPQSTSKKRKRSLGRNKKSTGNNSSEESDQEEETVSF
jgi:hypothetical protein